MKPVNFRVGNKTKNKSKLVKVDMFAKIIIPVMIIIFILGYWIYGMSNNLDNFLEDHKEKSCQNISKF